MGELLPKGGMAQRKKNVSKPQEKEGKVQKWQRRNEGGKSKRE